MDHLLNLAARNRAVSSPFIERSEYDRVRAFFTSASALPPTPLHQLRALAASLRLGAILIKDESSRFGLNAFKVAGVAYAIHRLIEEDRLPPGGMVVCASTGNHGRAVARAARDGGAAARIYVPAGTVQSRIAAIAGEGAEVVLTGGTYEAALRQAADDAARNGWTVVSDAAWPGYTEIPGWIMAGYTWLLEEAAGQWAAGIGPDIVLVQAGVGGLAAAVASWFADRRPRARPFVIVCEPATAACALASARAGRPVALDGPLETAMAGLRCAEISPVAWPALRDAVDAFVALEDTYTEEAMRVLGRPLEDDPVVQAGASGACGLAGLLAILRDDRLEPLRTASGIGPASRVLLINTEGATDPVHYAATMAAASGV